MSNEKETNNPKLKIILAIIGLIGTLGGAYFANADKLRGDGDTAQGSELSNAKGSDAAEKEGSDISINFSGDNNSNNQIVAGDNVENNTTNIFQAKKAETKAPDDIIKTLSPGTSLETAREIFGEPNKQDRNTYVYNQLENLYVRLVTDSSNTICSATFQRKDESSVFEMYPIDLFSLGKSTFSEIFDRVGEPDTTGFESGGTPKGGNYSSITEYFGGAGQYLTYTFGISKYLSDGELTQLPYSNEKVDFLIVTDDESCPDAVYSGLRWDEYM